MEVIYTGPKKSLGPGLSLVPGKRYQALSIHELREIKISLSGFSFLDTQSGRSKYFRFEARKFKTPDGCYVHLVVAKEGTEACKVFSHHRLFITRMTKNAANEALVRCKAISHKVKLPAGRRREFPLSDFRFSTARPT